MTEGSRLLRGHSLAVVARGVRVAERTVAGWRAGARLPAEAHQRALLEHFGIPLRAWSELAVQTVEPATATGQKRRSSAPLAEIGAAPDLVSADTEAALSALAARLMRDVDDATLTAPMRLKAGAMYQRTIEQRHRARTPMQAVLASADWDTFKHRLFTELQPFPVVLAHVLYSNWLDQVCEAFGGPELVERRRKRRAEYEAWRTQHAVLIAAFDAANAALVAVSPLRPEAA